MKKANLFYIEEEIDGKAIVIDCSFLFSFCFV